MLCNLRRMYLYVKSMFWNAWSGFWFLSLVLHFSIINMYTLYRYYVPDTVVCVHTVYVCNFHCFLFLSVFMSVNKHKQKMKRVQVIYIVAIAFHHALRLHNCRLKHVYSILCIFIICHIKVFQVCNYYGHYT